MCRFHDPLDHATVLATETDRRASHIVEERGIREPMQVNRHSGLIPVNLPQSQEENIPLKAHMNNTLRQESQFLARKDTVRRGGVINEPLRTTWKNAIYSKRQADRIKLQCNLLTFSRRPKSPRGPEQPSGRENALALVLENQNTVLLIRHVACAQMMSRISVGNPAK